MNNNLEENKEKKKVGLYGINKVMGKLRETQSEHFKRMKKEEVKKSKEFSCQICEVNEAVVSLESGSLRIRGKFCQPCAVVRLEKWSSWNEELEQEIKLKRGLNLMEAQMPRNKKK